MPQLIKKTMISQLVAYVHKVDMQEGGETPNVSAAMIVQVYPDDVVDLAVFHSNGMFFAKKISYSRKKERQTWHWIKLSDDPNGGD